MGTEVLRSLHVAQNSGREERCYLQKGDFFDLNGVKLDLMHPKK